MIKVAWLAPYNVFKLLPEIKLNRNIVLHNASWINTLSEQLALQKEIELHIITYNHIVEQSQSIKKNGINFHVIKCSFPFTDRGFPWYLPFDKLTGYYSFSKKARKIINEINPHILHVHGTEGGYFTPSFKSHVPCIISIQGIIGEYVKVDPNMMSYLQLRHEQKAIKKGKFFGCRTNFDFDYVRKRNKDAIIFDLPEAINKVFFEQQWKPQSELSLLFVGSIIWRKGIMDLIYALSKLKNIFPLIKLKIIGSGTKKYINHLKKIIDTHNLTGNIIWLGNKSPDEIASELSKSNFFVLPTLIDNSPNSLAEAMAVGTPSIATKTGGIPSMIADNIDGKLFEKHDVDELVNIIRTLVDNKEMQIKLSINARKKAFERNYPEEVANKYINVYKSLIK